MADALEPPPSELGLHPALSDFLAGGLAGSAGVVAGQPLDTVRIRLQQPGCPWPGSLAAARATIAAEGARALFRGTAYPLATISFQNAFVFQAYGIASRLLRGGTGSAGAAPEPLTYKQTFLAGMAAGVVQTAVASPVELLKIRQQLQTAPVGSTGHVGPLQLLRRLLAAEGVRGLYRGFGVTLVRDTPSHGVYFGMYEWSREVFDPGSREPGASAPAASFLAGGVAGACSWLSVYPVDVVKTRMQAVGAAHSRYRSWSDCVLQSYRDESAGVFVRGLSTTLVRAFVVNATIFSAYEAAASCWAPSAAANPGLLEG